MEQSASIENLAKAMVEVQKNDLFALKDSDNPFFRSKYADLSSVWSSARKPLTDNGLCVIQTNRASGNGAIIIVTTLMHVSGEWIRGELELTPDKNTPQGAGSAVTYGRRYGLQSIVGICPEDDDGNNASGKSGGKSPGKPNPQPPPGFVPPTDFQKLQFAEMLADAGLKPAGGKNLTMADAKKYGLADKSSEEFDVIYKELNRKIAAGENL